MVVTGTSLTGATKVDFGTTPGTNLVVTSDTSLDVTVPAGAGTVDVTVTVPGGTSPTNPSDQYTYVTAPEVTKVNPNTGPASGGTTVKIKGSGFTSATEVDFGPGNPTSFTVNSDTSITAVSPGSSAGAGPVHVMVVNPGGIERDVERGHIHLPGAPERHVGVPGGRATFGRHTGRHNRNRLHRVIHRRIRGSEGYEG